MNLKKWVKSIQTAGYNGTCTVNVLCQIIPYSHLILNSFNIGVYSSVYITLDGDAKLAQGNVEGYYTLTSTLVNGKQNWKHVQSSKAIWYDKEFKNWKIGDKKSLGTSTCRLFSTNDVNSPKDATTWKYWNTDDGEWMSTSNIFGSSSMY